MKIKVVCDTSSLITISMVNLIKKCLDIFDIIIPIAVIKEIKEASKYADNVGKSAKKLLNLIDKDKIKTYKIKNKNKVKNLLSSNINEGEAECIICCTENNVKYLIMDDIDAMYHLEDVALANKIETNISIWLLVELTRNKIITKKTLISTIKKMIKIRKWEGGVLEVLSRKYLENI